MVNRYFSSVAFTLGQRQLCRGVIDYSRSFGAGVFHVKHPSSGRGG